MSEQHPTHYQRRPSLFWPILLIGAGVVFLMSNLELLPADPWPLLGQLWPVILIIIGLDILLGRRSILGGVLSAVFALLLVGLVIALLFAAQNYPELLKLGTAELHSQYITHPLGETRQAQVELNFPAGPGRLFALDDSANLIEGDVRYYGELVDTFTQDSSTAHVQLGSRFSSASPMWMDSQQQKWLVGLNPRTEYDLRLEAGAGEYEFDLRQFTLHSLVLDAGSGQVNLALSEIGRYQFELNAGSGAIDMHVPEGVGVRVEYDAGSGELDAPGLRLVSGSKRDGAYESDNFSSSEHYVIIELDGGSGKVSIR